MMKSKLFLIITPIIFLIFSCQNEVFETPQIPVGINPCDSLNFTYQADFKLIIDQNCASIGCHDANSASGNFTSYEGLKVKLDNGSFEQRVIIQKNMPASGPLPQETIDQLKCWLENGYPKN